MRRQLTTLIVGLALFACNENSMGTDDGSGPAPSDLVVSVRYSDDEVSKDSNGEVVQVSVEGSQLTYELAHSGFGAEYSTDVSTTVELSAEELARIERWIAEGGLGNIASLSDTSRVDPGPHRRRGLSVSIEIHGNKHEFSLDGITSVKGSPTAFGKRDDLREAELFVSRLTDLARARDPQAFERKKKAP